MDEVITTNNNNVHVLELRRLLHALKDSGPDIGIRFRLIGEMWQSAHLRIFQITEKGVLMRDDHANKVIYIPDLNNVMQFELDQSFQQYQPHFHYSVDPLYVSGNDNK